MTTQKRIEISEVTSGIFRIHVPLPRNPLKQLNAWLVRGTGKPAGRNLLIDTGFNRPECEEVLRGALHELNVEMAQTDIFITHLHADHCGLVKKIADKNSIIYCSKADGEVINAATRQAYWDGLDALYAGYGFPVGKKRHNMEKHPGWEFNVKETIDYRPVDEGRILPVGDYALRCVWTPGHTPGHMCLYDEAHKILFSADHVLDDITPNITIEEGMDNPLRLYLDSLKKVEGLEVERVLTGHRNAPVSLKDRIRVLYQHHVERLAEVIAILREHTATAYEVAAQMHWDITCEHWEDFPVTQKWFATGEAIAHLQYLYYEGKANRCQIDGIYHYSRV
jgi:glyoxylase-like metal-dependent hydrolase (beta-lactamase superfamily II)